MLRGALLGLFCVGCGQSGVIGRKSFVGAFPLRFWVFCEGIGSFFGDILLFRIHERR